MPSPAKTTPGGHPVLHHSDPAYADLNDHPGSRAFGGARRINENISHLREKFPHYKLDDHDHAAWVHSDERNKAGDKGDKAAEVSANRAAQAHTVTADAMRRADKKAKVSGAKPSAEGNHIGVTGSGKPVLGHLHVKYSSLPRLRREQPQFRDHPGQPAARAAQRDHVMASNPDYTPQDHEDAAKIHSVSRAKATTLPKRHDDLARAHYAAAQHPATLAFIAKHPHMTAEDHRVAATPHKGDWSHHNAYWHLRLEGEKTPVKKAIAFTANARAARAPMLGTTRRGRTVPNVGHPSYAELEHPHVFGAEPAKLGEMARRA
ncbi:MAG: hypothetical protein EOO40_07655, partial [Deltaproteobacteria bacterium]